MSGDKKPREFEVPKDQAKEVGVAVPRHQECSPDSLRLIDKETYEWLLANHLHLKAFLYNLINDEGGTIVPAQQCSATELAKAKAKKRYIGIGVYGFVYVPSPKSEK